MGNEDRSARYPETPRGITPYKATTETQHSRRIIASRPIDLLLQQRRATLRAARDKALPIILAGMRCNSGAQPCGRRALQAGFGQINLATLVLAETEAGGGEDVDGARANHRNFGVAAFGVEFFDAK